MAGTAADRAAEQARVAAKESNSYDQGKAGAGPRHLGNVVGTLKNNGTAPKLGRSGTGARK